MTKFKKLIAGCIGAFIFAALPLASAQNAPATSAPTAQWHSGQRIYSQLNLTDDQKRQLEANKEQHRAKMGAIRQAMKASRQALQEELMKPQLDMTQDHSPS